MASYHDLEKSTYENIVGTRFTPIQDPCTWVDKEQLLQEMCDLAVTYDVHYDWAGEYGLLGSVANPDRYTADTTLVFFGASETTTIASRRSRSNSGTSKDPQYNQ
jgi:hypothetical protein